MTSVAEGTEEGKEEVEVEQAATAELDDANDDISRRPLSRSALSSSSATDADDDDNAFGDGTRIIVP